MTVVTSLTEQVVRELGIPDDWRVQQIAAGQTVHILRTALFANGEHINTKISSDAEKPLPFQKEQCLKLLVVHGDRVNTRDFSDALMLPEGSLMPDTYVPTQYVIVYNVHTPVGKSKSPFNKLMWLYVTPAVNLPKLKEEFASLFGV